jgi:hypothetical protein
MRKIIHMNTNNKQQTKNTHQAMLEKMKSSAHETESDAKEEDADVVQNLVKSMEGFVHKVCAFVRF